MTTDLKPMLRLQCNVLLLWLKKQRIMINNDKSGWYIGIVYDVSLDPTVDGEDLRICSIDIGIKAPCVLLTLVV